MAIKTGLAEAIKEPGKTALQSIFEADYETVIHHIHLNAIFNAS